MEADSEDGTKGCDSSSPGCSTEVETTEAAVTRTAATDSTAGLQYGDGGYSSTAIFFVKGSI